MIRRTTDIAGIAPEHDLVVRAARLLQAHTGCQLGADIAVHKVLPMGAGIGGSRLGAATTLIALNRLWQTGLGRAELQTLGLQLGADVPVFIFGRDAFAEGVGEALQPLELAPAWYVLVSPGVSIPTAEIFGAGDLTKHAADQNAGLRSEHDAKRSASSGLQALSASAKRDRLAGAACTGTDDRIGELRFAEVASAQHADWVAAQCPPAWTAWKVRSSSRHPLFEWLE